MDIIFNAIYFFTIAFSIVVMLFGARNIPDRISLLVFTFSYVVMAIAGYALLYYGWDEGRVAGGVVDKEIVFRSFLLACLTFYLVIFFYFGFRFFLRSFRTSSMPNSQGFVQYSKENKLIFLLFVISAGYTIISLVASGGGVLGFAGDARYIAELRSDLTHGDSARHWKVLIGSFSLQLCSVFYFVKYKNDRSKSDLFLFLAATILSFLSLLTTGEKAPVVWFLLMLAVAELSLSEGYGLSKGVVRYIAYGGLGLLGLLFLYVKFMSAASLTVALEMLLSRTLTGQVTPAYFYVEIFPDRHQFLMGRSFPNPGGVFPFENINVAYLVADYMNPNLARAGIRSSAPTAFWGELYANFSYLGVVFGAGIIGVLIAMLDFFSSRFKRSALGVALLSVVVLLVHKLSFANIFVMLFNIQLVFVVFLFFISRVRLKYSS